MQQHYVECLAMLLYHGVNFNEKKLNKHFGNDCYGKIDGLLQAAAKQIPRYNNIHEAVEAGNIYTVQAFFNQSGDINERRWDQCAPEDKWDTLLTAAVKAKQYRMVNFLIEKGANLDSPGSYERNPLEIAQHNKDKAMITMLTNANAIPKNKIISTRREQNYPTVILRP